MATPFRSWALLMLAVAMVIPQDVVAPQPKMSVRLLNHLPGKLTVHCKASVDKVDLGEQFVEAGKDYYFSFYVNNWGTSVYWCKFKFGSMWNSFDVWTGPGFSGPCQHCFWAVEVDGFYRAEEGREPTSFQKPWLH
ncbi:hypothetical protein M758_3G229600 [Ceratodon purpureus]|nr:hypothetical protein M758_3G229600 [Ceratodon purpureus]